LDQVVTENNLLQSRPENLICRNLYI